MAGVAFVRLWVLVFVTSVAMGSLLFEEDFQTRGSKFRRGGSHEELSEMNRETTSDKIMFASGRLESVELKKMLEKQAVIRAPSVDDVLHKNRKKLIFFPTFYAGTEEKVKETDCEIKVFGDASLAVENKQEQCNTKTLPPFKNNLFGRSCPNTWQEVVDRRKFSFDVEQCFSGALDKTPFFLPDPEHLRPLAEEDNESMKDSVQMRSYFGNVTRTVVEKFIEAFLTPAYEDPKGTLLPLRKNYWMEALDTQHHSFIDFYKNHYQTLVRSNSTDLESTRSFFEWFYVTKVSLPSLPRHLMDQLRVQYLDATERGTYEIEIVDKRVRYIVSKEWVTTSSLRGYIFGNPWIFVMSPNDKVYIARKQNGRFQHSSFLSGRPVRCAGTIIIKDGYMQFITPWSGHYTPTQANVQIFREYLRSHNVKVEKIRWVSSDQSFMQRLIRLNNRIQRRKLSIKAWWYLTKEKLRELGLIKSYKTPPSLGPVYPLFGTRYNMDLDCFLWEDHFLQDLDLVDESKRTKARRRRPKVGLHRQPR